MGLSLFDTVIRTYQQFLPGAEICLAKGREHFEKDGRDVDSLVQARIHADMLPLHFQIVTLVHMSAGAVTAARTGNFGAPDLTLDFDYAGLEAHVREARESIAALEPGEILALEGSNVTFRAGETTLPFTTEDFFLSFAVPHFYFHVTTAYDILRAAGIPIGKFDYLGNPRTLETK